MIGIPELYISIDGQPEFNVTDKIPKLEFLGLDSTPGLTNTYQDNSGLDGSIFNVASINKNIVNLNFFIHYHDYYEYKAIKHQIYQLFMQKRIYRVRTDAEPMFVQFLRPVTSEIKLIEDGVNDSQFTLPFENPTGYKYSRYDSLNQVDLWDAFPLGFDLPVMDRENFHFQNDVRFDLLNPSGVPIDPYQENHDFKAMVTYTGDEFSIVNYTSGTTLTIKRVSKGNEQFVINGCDVFLNGENVNTDTDFGNIKLETGFNDIHIIGSVDYDLQFEFPFIYV